MKKCSGCPRTYKYLPKGSIEIQPNYIGYPGWMYTCECKSTFLIKEEELIVNPPPNPPQDEEDLSGEFPYNDEVKYNWKSIGPAGCDAHSIMHPCGHCIAGKKRTEREK